MILENKDDTFTLVSNSKTIVSEKDLLEEISETDYFDEDIKNLSYPITLYWGDVFDSLSKAKENDPGEIIASGWCLEIDIVKKHFFGGLS